MTRTCAWCGKFMEEVCPECGRPAICVNPSGGARGLRARLLRRLLLGRVHIELKLFVCTPGILCPQVVFVGGLGGTRYGICESCDVEQRKEIAAI